ncbi:hypothetical protein BC937DRAFT_90234 [Endogone sp. FLAS-F59071]|nr:hypothetical protein BC937DRAFT_90234 [Endogone sp. FLAS-F59071]|eukprot:RUS17241.1 hypothetical protein BC937DRAFT_90234 [Endogone sp. FLAS-F59071]
MESFSLRCRNEEQLKLWESTLNKLLKESKNPISAGNITQVPPKRNVSNTTIGSLAAFNIAPRAFEHDDDAASFIESGEDEEDDDDEEDYDEEEVYDGWPAKQRSNSLHAMATNGQQGSGRPRVRAQDGGDYSSLPHHKNAVPPMPTGGSRAHPANFPGGMSLPPLPRTNLSTNGTAISTAQTDYGFYPASPPPSNPSSPTTSARASTSSSSSNQVWARGDQQNSPLADTVLKFMMTPEGATTPTEEFRQYPPQPTRTYSQSLAAQATGAGMMHPNGQQPPLPISNQTRLRSQSSPNIHRPNGHNSGGAAPWEGAPEVPRNNGYFPNAPSPTEASVSASRHSNGSGLREQYTVRPIGSNPQLSATAMSQDKNGSTTAPNSPGSIKLKLNFYDGIYVIVVPQEIEYRDLMEKVEKKIRLCGDPRATAGALRIKYQDEDGDMITINSDDDVQMGFEARGGGNTVNLFVN